MGVSGGKVEHISNELMDRVLERKEYMKELETKGYVEKVNTTIRASRMAGNIQRFCG